MEQLDKTMRHIGRYENGCLGMVSSYHIEILKGEIVWGVW
jgi:hypothetical protein